MDSSHPLDLPDAERVLEDLSTPSKSVDKSEAMFTMYLERSDEDDRKTTERWMKESDAILIFTGLFSAALASFIGISIQDLRPNSQDISAFYIRNIFHLLANTTTSPGSIVVPTLTDPPQISPPKYARWVNSLWFLSLLMSLTGALLAVFIQQWAHSYLRKTQEGRHSPHNRARIRAFHVEGIDKLHLPRVTRAVPILIHCALFLFFTGLPVFLYNVDRTVFNVAITWLGLCVGGYACVTLMPIFYRDSPYYSPLSSSAWLCVTTMLFVVYQFLKSFTPSDSAIFRWYNVRFSKSHLRWRSLRGMHQVTEESALQLPSNIDYRALSWMFGTLNEDDEFEQFFDALPGICASEALEDPLGTFIKPNEKMLSHALIGMMDRTLASDVIPEYVKLRRINVCTKAINVTSLLGPWWTLRRVLLGDWHGFSRSVQFGLFVQGWKNMPHSVTAFYAQYVVAVANSSVQERDDHWFQLTSGQLNVSKSLVQTYLAYGDSILLANVLYIVRRAIQAYPGSSDPHRSDILKASSRTLGSLCKFNIMDTLPEQREEFCDIWYQLVEAAESDSHPHFTPLITVILKSLRRLYMALHEGTSAYPMAFSSTTDDENPVLDDATSYPNCTIMAHRSSVRFPPLQLNESPPDTAGGTRPAAPSSDVPIPALSPGVLSVLIATPSPHRQATSSALTPPFPDFSAPGPSSGVPQTHPPFRSRMHSPAEQSPPVIPMPSPSRARRTLVSRLSSVGRGSPRSTTVSSSSDSMPSIPSPASGYVSMPSTAVAPGGLPQPTTSIVAAAASSPSDTMPFTPSPVPEYVRMPSPAVAPGGLPQPTTSIVAAAAVAPPGSMLETSAMAMPSLLLGPGATMRRQIIKLNGYGEFSGLLYHSPHSVVYHDELYPTALHLFEAHKFLDHRPDLADRIRQIDYWQVAEVTVISAELAEFTRRDWGNVALATMDEVLYLKFRQHGDLRTLLLATYPSKLVYVESGDPFWGDGAGQGMNELGKSLTRVRERMLIELGL